MRSRASARHAYLEAEVVTALAHQIRAIRMQRGWTQGVLAKRLGTTQAAVSRLEDPSYGRYTLQTLVELAKAFDAGMQVRFVSFVSMLQETFRSKPREVASFEEEAPYVGFFRAATLTTISAYISIQSPAQESAVAYRKVEFPKVVSLQPISINIK